MDKSGFQIRNISYTPSRQQYHPIQTIPPRNVPMGNLALSGELHLQRRAKDIMNVDRLGFQTEN